MDSEQYIHKNDDDLLIPGHGQQDHEDPDGQRRRLDDPQHRQQGERIPLLRAERERCGEDHFLHFILLIFNFPSDQLVLLGKYSFSCRLKCVLTPGGERDHKVPARWSDTIGRQQTVRVSFKR